ncbi:Type I Iterative PKS [Marasmius oreades]|uniref:Type I Iterative PKS n=1 Tax=Marasmius oreades TaxID=181124 RepID=A0A9P7US12_9AGAR|nr:Type I Iterative PKS [Marasmius oreades]KAG7091670.1 Type I Iterative PKS [Marasmius oreades]
MPVKYDSSGPERLPKHEPIAIIGMAVDMPGSPDVSKLWETLERGINTISEIPMARFEISPYDGRNPRRQMKTHTGNFLDDADEFDNKFFRISPREALDMDPHLRILLRVSHNALEDAGYVPDATPCFSWETFGCYIGGAATDYRLNLQNDIDLYYLTGNLAAFFCGRVSYAFKLGGPSMMVDTACSASAVALYQACRALSIGDCRAALTGGVNVFSSPDLFLGLDRAHFLSPSGQCQAFDASADGYSRGEGCGMFVLKRLSDAIDENDRILGVIRAIEVNQSCYAPSITHPHSPSLSALFRTVLKNAGIQDLSRVNLVEAHGTGTQAGDPIEMESIREVLCGGRNAANPLHVTSIKGNIGHLELASGSASLAKLLLMLRHGVIPAQISLKALNPNIVPLDSDHTVIHTQNSPWNPSHPGMTRMALFNNFGAGGSNVATLIEEYVPLTTQTSTSNLPFVFGFSAKDERAAVALRDRYVDFLRTSEEDFVHIAYTMTARRQLYEYRGVVVASTKDEAIEKLQTVNIRQVEAQGNHKSSPPGVVFVFSGQGGQFLGMGRDLYKSSGVFRTAVDKCQEILVSLGFSGIMEIITESGNQLGAASLQSAVFAVEYALAQLWMSWGVLPSALIGHSLGEYAALVIAKVLTLREALFIVSHRARLMFQRCPKNTSAMLALNYPGLLTRKVLLAHAFSDLTVSCFNSPNDCIVSGSVKRLEAFREVFKSSVGGKSTLLDVPFGYHSQHMEPLLDDLHEIASKVRMSPPVIPIASNVLGAVVQPGDASVFNADYIVRHCAEPVQFEKGAYLLAQEVLGRSQRNVWIEIGPHPITIPYLKTNSSVCGPQSSFLPSIRKRQDAWLTLTSSLSELYRSNVPVKWRETFSHVKPSCVSLPSYPFSKDKFWVPYVEPHLRDLSAASRQQHLRAPILTCPVRENGSIAEQNGHSAAPRNQKYPGLPKQVQSLVGDEGSETLVNDVLQVISSVLGIHVERMGGDTTFESLGLDSLASIEVHQEIKDLLKMTLPDDFFLHNTKITAIRQYFSQKASVGPTTASKPLGDEILRVISSVLGVPLEKTNEGTSFEALGLDSLASIEVHQEVQERLKVTLSDNFLLHHTTVLSVRQFFSEPTQKEQTVSTKSHHPVHVTVKANEIKQDEYNEMDSSTRTIVRALHLSSNPKLVRERLVEGSVPVFLIHDGSGLCGYYEKMPSLSHTLWALHNPRFLSSKPWENLFEMTKFYAELILSTVSEGNVILGGWSFGSIAAYETALQLRKLAGSRNLHVQGLLLIDPPPNPFPPRPVPIEGQEENETVPVPVLQNSTNSKVKDLIGTQFVLNPRLLYTYDPFKTPKELGNYSANDLCPRITLLRSKEPYTPILKNGKPAWVPAWLGDRSDPTAATKGWNTLTSKEIKVWGIPGNHFEPFLPQNIGDVARCIEEALDYLT